MENYVLRKLPRYFAFALARDQRHCTKRAFGDLGACGLGVLAALVRALVPAQSTAHPALRFPPQLGSAGATAHSGDGRGFFYLFCSIYFANEPFGSFADAVSPRCALCPPPTLLLLDLAHPCAGTQSRCCWHPEVS